MVAVADEEDVVVERAAIAQRHDPTTSGSSRGRFDTGVKCDPTAKIEVIDVIAEVADELAVAREIRPIGRHGIVFERQTPFRGVDVQALVAGGQAVGVLEIPVAADVIGDLETVEIDATVLQPLGGGETRTPRADDAGLGPSCSGHARLLITALNLSRGGVASPAAEQGFPAGCRRTGTISTT